MKSYIPLIVIGTASAALLLLVITSGISYVEYRDWERYKRRNGCKLVSQMSTIRSGGIERVVVLGSPKREAWLCNDGKTHWRQP